MTRLEELTPAGTQTYSKRADRYAPGCPEKLRYGLGCTVQGSDGKDYVDLVSALGAVIIGYQDRDVDHAIVQQLAKGISFSLATDIEEEVAELVCDTVPGAEMVRFGKNGADACAFAVRLARAVTGRNAVLSIGYHGYQDWTIAPPGNGVPLSVQLLREDVAYGDLDALECGLKRHAAGPVACLIMEPVVATHPIYPPVGYLEACRELCTQHGALLIFDEVVTGFRMELGGAQQHFGIRADLVASGKAMANGLPLSVVTGPRDLMKKLGGEVFASTTFGGETLSLAAARATITKLRDERVTHQIAVTGRAIIEAYTAVAQQAGLGAVTRIIGYPQRPVIVWDDPALAKNFNGTMLDWGFLFQGYFNLTLAHRRQKDLLCDLTNAFTVGMSVARG